MSEVRNIKNDMEVPVTILKAGGREANGRFTKGISGNPSGRPAQPEDVKEMLKAATAPAVQLLVDTMNDREAKPELRVRCAELLIDRVLGKAVQPLEAHIKTETFDLSELTVDELRRLAAIEESDYSENSEE